jgi:hypothetical protein
MSHEKTISLESVTCFYNCFDQLYEENYSIRWNNFQTSTEQLKNEISEFRKYNKTQTEVPNNFSLLQITNWFKEFLFMKDYHNFITTGEIFDPYFEELVKQVTKNSSFIHPTILGEFDIKFSGHSGVDCRLSCISSNFFQDYGEAVLEKQYQKKNRKQGSKYEGYHLRVTDIKELIRENLNALYEIQKTVQTLLFNKTFQFDKSKHSIYKSEFLTIPKLFFNNQPDKSVLTREYVVYKPSFMKKVPLEKSNKKRIFEEEKNKVPVKTPVTTLSPPPQKQPLKRRKIIKDDDDVDSFNSSINNLNKPLGTVVVTPAPPADSPFLPSDGEAVVNTPFAKNSNESSSSDTNNPPSSSSPNNNKSSADIKNSTSPAESVVTPNQTSNELSSPHSKEPPSKESSNDAADPTSNSNTTTFVDASKSSAASTNIITKSSEFLKHPTTKNIKSPVTATNDNNHNGSESVISSSNSPEKSLELFWNTEYHSATLNKYIDLNDSFLQSVILDLKNISIEIANTNKQLGLYKDKTVLTNFLICPTYSSFVWYNYLMQLWNNADNATDVKSSKKLKKVEFINFTACTIFYLYFSITDAHKFEYQKNQTTFSLYQLLVVTRLLFINKSIVANNVNVLSFICKRKLFYNNNEKQIEPFEALVQRREYLKKIICGNEKVLLMLNSNNEWTISSLVTYFTTEIQIEKEKRACERIKKKKNDKFFIASCNNNPKKRKSRRKKNTTDVESSIDYLEEEKEEETEEEDEVKEENENKEEKKKEEVQQENINKEDECILVQTLKKYYSKEMLHADPLYERAFNNIIYSGLQEKMNPDSNTVNGRLIADLSCSFDEFLNTPKSAFHEGNCGGFLKFKLFSTLMQSKWLNDNVNTAYSVLLTHREKLLRRIDTDRPRILYIDSLIFSKLISSTDDQDKKSRTFRKLKMSECDKIFFFANQKNQHWILFEVNLKTLQITIYDSLIKQNFFAESQASKLIDFLVFNIPSTKINDWNKISCNKCQFQTNSNDCGVFMLTFGLFLADFAVENVEYIDCEKLARLKIALDITRGYIEDPRLQQTLTEDLSGKYKY